MWKISLGPEKQGETYEDQSGGYKIVLFVYSLISYPHETTTGMDFSCEMVMASTGQYIRHR
jgi:hypothetical protein